MTAHKIRVVKDNIVFCSGHFATFEGEAEPLHGHNYRAAAALEGALDENAWVFDFVTLKRMMKAICDRLDHRMLLPTGNPLVSIQADPISFTARAGHKTYVFPREDVVQLPIPNTTAEMLAEWIGGELIAALRERGAAHLTAVEIEVEEVFGQSAFCRKEIHRQDAKDTKKLNKKTSRLRG